MKKLLLISVAILGSLGVKAQQNPFFTHFALNPLYYNAGWIGMEDVAYAALHHRSQWVGYPQGAAPTTQLLSLAVPLKWKLSGVGLNVINDQLGPVSNFEVQLGTAYKKDFRFGELSFGIMAGIFSKTLNGDDLIFVDPSDPLNFTGKESQINPDISAGLFFKSRKNYFVGLGATNILQPSFNFGVEDFSNKVLRTFNLSGGATYKVGRNITFTPSALLRSDLQTYTVDIGSMISYKTRLWGGITYRLEESANILLGYSFLENMNLKLGYSFEYIIQQQEAKQPVSFELFLRYDLPDVIFGGKKQVRTPRFRF